MKFDIICLGDHLPDPHARRYADTQAERHRMWVDLGIHAEAAGYDAYWLGEHHCSNYILSAPQMLLAAIAVQTRHIRLGTAVSLLPNNDPVRLAEDFATLDLLSEGRAEIGFGGGFTEHTFKLFGQDIAHSAEIAAENLDLVQKLWNETDIDWRGRFRAPIHESQIQPRTYSGRAIPINRATASSMETARHAGRSGHRLMLMTVFGTFADMRELGDAYREAYCAAGHDPLGMSVAVLAYVHVHRSGAAARRHWAPYRDNYRAFTKMLTQEKGVTKGIQAYYDKLGPVRIAVRESDFCGDPAEITDKVLAAHADVGGFDRLICYFDLGGLPRRDTFEAVDLFAGAAMPAIRRSLHEPAAKPPEEARTTV